MTLPYTFNSPSRCDCSDSSLRAAISDLCIVPFIPKCNQNFKNILLQFIAAAHNCGKNFVPFSKPIVKAITKGVATRSTLMIIFTQRVTSHTPRPQHFHMTRRYIMGRIVDHSRFTSLVYIWAQMQPWVWPLTPRSQFTPWSFFVLSQWRAYSPYDRWHNYTNNIIMNKFKRQPLYQLLTNNRIFITNLWSKINKETINQESILTKKSIQKFNKEINPELYEPIKETY